VQQSVRVRSIYEQFVDIVNRQGWLVYTTSSVVTLAAAGLPDEGQTVRIRYESILESGGGLETGQLPVKHHASEIQAQ